MREFDDSTPVEAVPGGITPGERLIWQGTPRWQTFALRVLHIRKLAIYFALLMAWRFAADVTDGLTVVDGLVSAAWIAALATVALSLIAGYAWAVGRSTVYTVTSRRLILRHGVALPVTITVPMDLVEAADLKRYADGSGDIAIAVSAKARLSYVMLWPHARPWRFARPEASLRAIGDVDTVATALASALETETRAKAIHTTGQARRPAAPARGQLASAAG